MTCSTEQAEKEMFALAKATLNPLLAAGAVVMWPNTEQTDPPSQTKEWVRVSIKHEDGGQGSLSNQNGVRRWRRQGHLNLQFFVPFTAGGRSRARLLACALRDAFQGTETASAVWFRRCNAMDIGQDKSWYNWNTSIGFTYDEVK